MLKSQLLQPEILAALGKAGHGAKVLIADGNFAFGPVIHPRAQIVWLNLAPGMVTVTDVLKVLIDAMPIEAVDVMMPDSGEESSIHADFRSILSANIPVTKHKRFAF